MQPFLALITPLTGDGGGGGHPDRPPNIWGGGNVPMPNPPIANVPGAPGYTPPGSPPGTWGGAGEPFPGYGLPGNPGGGTGSPPGTWGGAGEGFPTPPIVIPPTEPGKPPLVIWGPGDPRPTPPIELPGGGNPPPGGEPVKLVEWKTAWSESTGWVVVGIPQVPHPAPSADKTAAKK